MSDIIYTYTDEAPAMATFSLFPIIKKFLNSADIDIQIMDISLAGRILSAFPERLNPEQRVDDYLKILGEMTKSDNANIIKLPNISASMLQLNDCIDELIDKNYNIPRYPAHPKTDEEKDVWQRYQRVLGSAVNPVLREGNSDRRCANAVKEYARANPHKNGKWNKENRAEVVYMDSGDFYENEKSKIFNKEAVLKITFKSKNGNLKVLKENLKIVANEVVDATYMSAKKLDEFIVKSINYAKQQDLLYSIHLKATMMKVSDPVIFGHFVKNFFAEIFSEFGDTLRSIGVNENNGLKDLFAKIKNLDDVTKDKIQTKFDEIYSKQPSINMVDSDKGITNLHVSSDVIIDASMPAMIRNSGRLWDKNGDEKECLAVIPDRTYAVIYDSIIKYFKEHGEINPATAGSVANVGLMAKKAEEYGSHDKTFIMEDDGELIVSEQNGSEIFKFELEKGDIFRMTQTKDEAIKNWIKLAVSRANVTKNKTIFWLDEERAHDLNIKNIVQNELKKYDTNELDIEILNPYDATAKSVSLIKEGKDCISVTGNVLRDYLTDLFPILELGTSAKMLSIVPLLNGGGMFETGAGGSAPKIAQQIFKENHLRWDSLGEFMALIVSLEHLAEYKKDEKIKNLSQSLDKAVSKWLKDDRAPRKKIGEPDNRNSHFYLALYWAQELAKQNFKPEFDIIAKQLRENEEVINSELIATQGKQADLGGYYLFDEKLANQVMRPSKVLNLIIG